MFVPRQLAMEDPTSGPGGMMGGGMKVTAMSGEGIGGIPGNSTLPEGGKSRSKGAMGGISGNSTSPPGGKKGGPKGIDLPNGMGGTKRNSFGGSMAGVMGSPLVGGMGGMGAAKGNSTSVDGGMNGGKDGVSGKMNGIKGNMTLTRD